jgi:transcription elongation factor SPT6
LFLIWQLSEELTGTGEELTKEQIEEESLWVHSQLTADGFISFAGNEHVNTEIDQKDILNVLTMLHVNKFEVQNFVLQVFLSQVLISLYA